MRETILLNSIEPERQHVEDQSGSSDIGSHLEILDLEGHALHSILDRILNRTSFKMFHREVVGGLVEHLGLYRARLSVLTSVNTAHCGMLIKNDSAIFVGPSGIPLGYSSAWCWVNSCVCLSYGRTYY